MIDLEENKRDLLELKARFQELELSLGKKKT